MALTVETVRASQTPIEYSLSLRGLQGALVCKGFGSDNGILSFE